MKCPKCGSRVTNGYQLGIKISTCIKRSCGYVFNEEVEKDKQENEKLKLNNVLEKFEVGFRCEKQYKLKDDVKIDYESGRFWLNNTMTYEGYSLELKLKTVVNLIEDMEEQ